MSQDKPLDLQYLCGDVTPGAAAAVFRAAAQLHQATPWELLLPEEHRFEISSEPLGLRGAAVAVIGEADEARGVALFERLADFHRYCDAWELVRRGAPASFPRHLALTYHRRAKVGAALRDEVAANRWEVAGAHAYPVIAVTDDGGVVRGPTCGELLRVEAILRAIEGLVRESPLELDDALAGGSVFSLRRRVETSGGDVDLDITVSANDEPDDPALCDDNGSPDDERVEIYCTEILERFRASPELRTASDAHWAEILVHHTTVTQGRSMATLRASEFHEILFDVIPRQVGMPATEATELIAGLRAFLAFVRRESPSSSAERCLALLDGDAAQRLERLLAEPSNYGPAKWYVMSGQAAGFDMASQAGRDAWQAYAEQHDLRVPVENMRWIAPPQNAPAQPRATRKPKKTRRKAQRAARKKNRSR